MVQKYVKEDNMQTRKIKHIQTKTDWKQSYDYCIITILLSNKPEKQKKQLN